MKRSPCTAEGARCIHHEPTTLRTRPNLGTDELHASITDAIRGPPRARALGAPGRATHSQRPRVPPSSLARKRRTGTRGAGGHRTGQQLRTAVTDGVGVAIRSVHQRGYEVALPLELLELLIGGAEIAALAESLPRDTFDVVNSILSDNCQAGEGLRCTSATPTSPRRDMTGRDGPWSTSTFWPTATSARPASPTAVRAG